jgi:hypothetical protein
MSSIRVLLCLSGLLAAPASGQEPPVTEEPQVSTPAEQPAPQAAVEDSSPARIPAVVWPLSAEGIEEHLVGIERAHPECATLETIGVSTSGREIRVLRLGVREKQATRPTLFLADHRGRDSAGPEAMLTLAWRLADNFSRDEDLRALFGRTTLVLAPSLDPDVRAEAGEARSGARFELNFPSGWQPESLRAGAGRISLCTKESLAVASFLANWKGCTALIGFAPRTPRGAPYAQAELPAADRETFARFAAALSGLGGPALAPWSECAAIGGSVFDFAYQARGIYPFLFELPLEEALFGTGAGEFASGVEVAVRGALELLPRLVISLTGLERVAADTWRVDVSLENTGLLPTSSALARRREAFSDLLLAVEGAKLFAVDRKGEPDRPYADASFEVRSPLFAGTLEGGERRAYSLFLEGTEGSAAEVRVTSPCAGEAFLAVELR